MLRHFLCLDNALVDEFLSQLEGGLFEDESQSTTASTDKTLGGGLRGGPLGGEAKRTKGDEETVARILRQTPESKFDRLVALLRAEGALAVWDAADAESWEGLARGEIVELDAMISVPALIMMLRSAGGFGELLPVLAKLSDDPLEDEMTEAVEAMEAMGRLSEEKVPIVASLSASPEYKFLLQLDSGGLRVPFDELEAEGTLVVKIRRKLRPGERQSTVELFSGQSSLPLELRTGLVDSLTEGDDEFSADLAIQFPAATATPIAIFR